MVPGAVNRGQNINETLGVIHWHWRNGWSLLGLIVVVAVIVAVVRFMGSNGGKGGES